MPTDRIIYYRGMVIIKDNKHGVDSYRIIVNGIKSSIALTSVQAAQTVIDTHLKNKNLKL